MFKQKIARSRNMWENHDGDCKTAVKNLSWTSDFFEAEWVLMIKDNQNTMYDLFNPCLLCKYLTDHKNWVLVVGRLANCTWGRGQPPPPPHTTMAEQTHKAELWMMVKSILMNWFYNTWYTPAHHKARAEVLGDYSRKTTKCTNGYFRGTWKLI